MKGDVTEILSAVVAGFAVVLVEAWIAMLLLGAAHHEVSDSVPAVGYFGSLVIVTALGLLAGIFRRG